MIKRDQSKIWETYDGFMHYQHSVVANERSAWFVDKLDEYEFSSALEIGSCVGRNLSYISKRFPGVKLSGIEINKDAVSFARKKNPGIDFKAMDIYDVEEDKKWDLVFTMCMLIHIHPDGIYDVIKKCISMANKYIIHIERNGDNSVITGPKELSPEVEMDKLHWKPNIVDIYRKLGFDKVKVIDVPRDFSKSGASHFVVVDLV